MNLLRKLIQTSELRPSSSLWWDLKDCLLYCCQRFKYREDWGFDDPWPFRSLVGVLQTLAIDMWIREAHCTAQCLCSFEWTGLPPERSSEPSKWMQRPQYNRHVRLLWLWLVLCACARVWVCVCFCRGKSDSDGDLHNFGFANKWISAMK